MSVHFPLNIGSVQIGHIEIVRTETGAIPATGVNDAINTYTCRVRRHRRGTLRFTLTHRYGDSVWALVHAAIGRVIEFDSLAESRMCGHLAVTGERLTTVCCTRDAGHDGEHHDATFDTTWPSREGGA